MISKKCLKQNFEEKKTFFNFILKSNTFSFHRGPLIEVTGNFAFSQHSQMLFKTCGGLCHKTFYARNSLR
jgi:hypothetical protein